MLPPTILEKKEQLQAALNELNHKKTKILLRIYLGVLLFCLFFNFVIVILYDENRPVSDTEIASMERAIEKAEAEIAAAEAAKEAEEEPEPVDLPSYIIEEVENILQNPELPNGCEIVSLAILLNYYGYDVDKVDLLENYTPIIPIGSDYPTVGYYGNPSTTNSFGCYAPVIETAANNYLSAHNSELEGEDITGTAFEDLYQYINEDNPVEIWATMYMEAPYDSATWTMPDGNTFSWQANEHALVLYGYDKENDLAYVSDPLAGNRTYSLSLVKQRYEELGSQAVVILNS